MKPVKKIIFFRVLKIFSLISGCFFLLVLWAGIIRLYFYLEPQRGIDFYLTATNVKALLDNFTLPFNFWWYQWYGGRPWDIVYPLLHFYLSYPWAKIWGIITGVKIYISGSLTLFVVFCYLLFNRLVKNFALAFFLAGLSIFSVALYLSLFWGGNLPYTATLFFYPLSLYLTLLFLETKSKNFLYLSALISGLALLGHPQVVVAWILPINSLFLFFPSVFSKNHAAALEDFSLKRKFLTLLQYWSGTALVGFRQLAFVGLGGIINLLMGILKGRLVGVTAEVTVNSETEVAQQILAQRNWLFKIQEVTHTIPRWINPYFAPLLLIALFIFILTFYFSRKRNFEFPWKENFLLLLSLTFYGFLFALLFFMGLNPFAGGWIRIYWGFAILSSLLIGLLIRPLILIWDDFSYLDSKKFLLEILLSLFLLFFAFSWFAQQGKDNFLAHIITRSHGFPDQPEVLHEHAQESSAYPTVLNLTPKIWQKSIFKPLVPRWLDADRLDYRLYDMDATVNIWWNAYFKMPLVRGYLDSPGGPNYDGWQYWMNVVLNKDEIVKRLKVDPSIAREQTLFFIDWHAMKYLEGKGGVWGRDFGVPFSQFLLSSEVIKRSEEVKLWRPLRDIYIDLPGYWETLKFYEIKENLVSPIYQASNAPAFLIVGDREAQNIFMRLAGSLNLNSQKAIIVQGSENLSDYSLAELKRFKALFLYRYRSPKVDWTKLEKYIEEGGFVFLDTGDERPEAESDNLPPLFPIVSNQRAPLGRDWRLEKGKGLKDLKIDLNLFTVPIFNGEPWSFSYSSVPRNGAEIWLKNYGQTILAGQKIGQGYVLWSGMNFPYHSLREYNLQELQLWRYIFSKAGLLGNKDSIIVETKFQRPSPQKAIINSGQAPGVLFKEANYSGWQAVVTNGAQRAKVKIFSAGPMEPGYMYVFIPEQLRSAQTKVIFTFSGSMKIKFYYLVNLLGVLLLLDLIGGKRGLHLLSFLARPLSNYFKEWWEKDEDY